MSWRKRILGRRRDPEPSGAQPAEADPDQTDETADDEGAAQPVPSTAEVAEPQLESERLDEESDSAPVAETSEWTKPDPPPVGARSDGDDELRARAEAAEARAAAEAERAERLEQERDQVEARAKEAATEWLRGQKESLKSQARERVSAEIERARAETEATVRAEAEERLREQSERLEPEAERLISEQAQRADVDDEQDDDRTRPELDREAAAAALREALIRLEDAEVRATAAENAQAEIAAAREAAEDRFAETLDERERELEREREEKAEIVEASDRRLAEIEARAEETAKRIAVAGQRLADEAERLQTEAADHVERERERVRVEATAAAAEARAAAADWLRGQTKALRKEGQSGLEDELATAKRRIAELEREPSAAGGRAPTDARQQWAQQRSREERFRAAAARLGGAGGTATGDAVVLRDASFEQLRELGMTAKQAKRVLRYRGERGLDSVEQLADVPGIPAALVAELSGRLVD